MDTRPATRVVFPAPVVVTLLRASGVLDRIGTRAAVSEAQLPSARVTVVSAGSGVHDWTDVSAQIDVWAADEGDAGDLAAALATYWRSLLSGDVLDAYVSGCWLESAPRPVPDPDTSAARYSFDVGLRLHPLETR